MKLITKAFFLAAFWILGSALGAPPLSALEAAPPGIVGDWHGTLENTNLKVVIHIKENPGHLLSSVVDSVTQNSFGIPVSQTSFEKGRLRLDVAAVNATYDGQLSQDGDEIHGTWSQGQNATLNLKKTSGNSTREISGPIVVEPLDNGLVKMSAGQDPIATLTAMVFTEGWQYHSFHGESDDPQFDSFLVLPEGGRIGMKSKIEVLKTGLRVHATLKALDPLTLIAARFNVELPCSNWTGLPYQLGKSRGTIPVERSSNTVLATATVEELRLGSLTDERGLRLKVTAPQLTTLLQDGRQWGDALEIILSHGEGSDKPWTWKADDEKTFDFTLYFNRDLVVKPNPIASMEPQRPFPYSVETVTFEDQKAGVRLAGTLTLPKGEGPFPAILLIQGSGTIDRNETVDGHHIFLVMSDYLTRKGFAVLRYDKRGVGNSTGNIETATTEDFAQDSLAALDYLKSRKEVNRMQIGLVGHSEGGLIAPMIAARSKEIAFIVLMAGPGVSGEKISLDQARYMFGAQKTDEKSVNMVLRIEERIIGVLKTETNKGRIKDQVKKIVQEETAQESPEERKALETSALAIDQQMGSPWEHFFLNYDPKNALKKVACPVLAVNGELDWQVPSQEDLSAIGVALKEGKNTDFETKEFPKMNHLFQECQTGNPTEYAAPVPTPANSVLDYMMNWIERHIK